MKTAKAGWGHPPYLASEDSALLRRALQGYSGERCLEIGAGNGGNLVALSGRFELVVGVDIIRPGIFDWGESGADYLLGDLASCFRDSTFDLVAFNPPYLRGEAEDRAVDGGEGLEVPREFMKEALRVVTDAGRVVFLLNQENDVAGFEKLSAERGFGVHKVASERGFFEELSVYVAERA